MGLDYTYFVAKICLKEVADNFSKDKSVIFLSPEGEPRELVAEDKTLSKSYARHPLRYSYQTVKPTRNSQSLSKTIKGSKHNYEIKPHSERFKAGEKRSELEENAGQNWRKKMTEYNPSGALYRVDENKRKI